MKCSHCDADNRDDARFCRNCGQLLNESHKPETVVPAADRLQLAAAPDAPALAVADAVTPERADRPADSPASDGSVAPTHTAPDQPPSTSALIPLEVGAELVAGRYVILEIVTAAEEANVYRARDMRGCPVCHAENAQEEQYCVSCGRELTDRPTVLLDERAASDDVENIASPAFVAAGRVYTVKEPASEVEEQPAFPGGVHLSFGMQSNVGIVRAVDGVDEDSVFGLVTSAMYESIAKPTVGLFIVADGIGGSEAGEVASKEGIEVATAELLNKVVLPVLAGTALDDETVRVRIEDAVTHANTAVWELAHEKGNDMGSTITLALVIDDRAYVANVGDSRTYLFDGGKLQQITHDHSLVASLVAQKMIEPEEIYTHPQRNMIFRSLGGKPEIVVDIFPQDGGALKMKPGARLLLCCDGLWEMLHSEGIEELLLQPQSDLQKLCETLVERANEAGGEDNISVIVVKVD